MAREIHIRSDWREGDVERIVDLHRRGYQQEGGHYGADFLDHVRREHNVYMPAGNVQI